MIAVISVLVFNSQILFLFKLLFLFLSLLAATLPLCFSVLCLVWVYSLHILIIPPHSAEISSEI